MLRLQTIVLDEVVDGVDIVVGMDANTRLGSVTVGGGAGVKFGDRCDVYRDCRAGEEDGRSDILLVQGLQWSIL